MTKLQQRLRRFESLVDEDNVVEPARVEALTRAIRSHAFVPGVRLQLMRDRREVGDLTRAAYEHLLAEAGL